MSKSKVTDFGFQVELSKEDLWSVETFFIRQLICRFISLLCLLVLYRCSEPMKTRKVNQKKAFDLFKKIT